MGDYARFPRGKRGAACLELDDSFFGVVHAVCRSVQSKVGTVRLPKEEISSEACATTILQMVDRPLLQGLTLKIHIASG
jgi:hypothetical protein